jgi:hypothetical protein
MLSATATGALVTAAANAGAASFGNPDEPPQGAINAKNASSVTDPGPQNPTLAGQFPTAQSPPPTDVGELPQYWASFNNSAKRFRMWFTHTPPEILSENFGLAAKAFSKIPLHNLWISCRPT